ncbi:MAG: four helix bundle suffix domain-containing protein [Bacteroidota bacterium]|nr:four helix bundle suffix domain-containing protein [Bacteroidota bacterium]
MKKRDPRYSLVLPPHGGYRKLVSFQLAELLYDVTVRFIDRYIPSDSRTRDQMEQSARSGVRNIAEGSMLSATTKKLEMNLTNVARGSLDELRADYESFLTQRGLSLWPLRDQRRMDLTRNRFKTTNDVARWVKMLWVNELQSRTPVHPKLVTERTPKTVEQQAAAEISANVAHALCVATIRLLDKLVNSQARAFETEGGFNERLYRVRTQVRNGTWKKD